MGFTDLHQRTCFFISAFGQNPEDQRKHKQVLRHLVQKVLEDRYQVVRADQIDEEGLITNQIIEHLLEDDLVVADLTGLNPNVFYEIAVRHAARKPIVHLITRDQEIPFDVANMRAVQYALDDPDVLEEAQDELGRKVQAIEDSGFKAAANPISAARDVWLLRENEQPEIREAGNLLAAFNELKDEVRILHRGLKGAPDPPVSGRMSLSLSKLETALRELGPAEVNELAENLGVDSGLVRIALRKMAERKEAFRLDDGRWSPAPF
jgi:hypothetical protein